MGNLRRRILTNSLAPLRPVDLPRPLRLRDEAEGKDRLRAFGGPIPRGEVVPGDQMAVVAARIGHPVVLKMMDPRLAHNSGRRLCR